MSSRADWVKIILTIAERAAAHAEARRRDQWATDHGARPRGGDGTRKAHLVGTLGEWACAQYLNVPPPAGLTIRQDHRQGYDLAGWCVRTVQKPGNRLYLREHERTGTWVLVMGYEAMTTGVCYLAGWITAEKAWRHATRRQDAGQAYYVVDSEHLYPLPPITREGA